jgi:cell division septation protein DedD
VREHWYFAVDRGTILAGLTSHPTDDGFHEIQLNGKQLVFLFMAATVVSVVIFLCGVLVGRGVRAERGAVAIAEVPLADQIEPTAGSGPALDTAGIHSAPPPAAVDERPSLCDRLEKSDPGLDELKSRSAKASSDSSPAAPPVSTSRPAAVAVSTPTPKPAPPPVSKSVPLPTAKPVSASAASTPASRPAAPAASGAKSGYVVQLAALNSRGEADAMVKRLSAKGYEAFVQAPAENAPAIFRVRVGNYPTRGEAETAAARLQKEGQFKPWVAAR